MILKTWYISIHASAREATSLTIIQINSLRDFNPRLREGGDNIASLHRKSLNRFQSTPPRGRRRNWKDSTTQKYRFQSTPPRGRRQQRHRKIIMVLIFQSTPPRGRRLAVLFKDDPTYIISIHASAREATALITKIHLKHHISFQHTVHKSPFNVNYPFQ